MAYILALDQGTTSSRAIVFDRDGHVRALAQQEFPQIFPAAGWVEHDPEAIWASQHAVSVEALRRGNISAKEIAAIAIANQRETTVIWNRRTGRPIHNAIVWQDRRTAPLCDQLKQDGLAATIQQKTGLIIDPYFSASKVRWLLDNVPGARAAAERGELAFGTIDSWLLWKLTAGAVHATDGSNASRTMLYNIHTRDWDDELLERLQLPRSLLAPVRASSEVYGPARSELFGGAIPIA